MVVIKIYNILKCYWGRVKNERWRSICPKKISSKLQKYDFSHHMIKLETICQNLKKKNNCINELVRQECFFFNFHLHVF